MDRGYTRYLNRKKALRKRKLVREIYRMLREFSDAEYYDNLHQYSKNKIHCSCSWCYQKTKNKGRKRLVPGNYNPSHNPTASDRRKIAAMDDQLKDLQVDNS